MNAGKTYHEGCCQVPSAIPHVSLAETANQLNSDFHNIQVEILLLHLNAYVYVYI